MGRIRLRAAWPAAALTVGALVVAMLACLALLSSVLHQFKVTDLGQVALWLSFGLVGVVAAWHQPRNSMGWVLLGVTFFFTLDDAAHNRCRKYCAAADAEIGIHELRHAHAHATELINSGVSIEVVRRRLGHAGLRPCSPTRSPTPRSAPPAANAPLAPVYLAWFPVR